MEIFPEDFHALSHGSLMGITSRCVARVVPILGYWADKNPDRLAWVEFAEDYLSKIRPADEPANDVNLMSDHLAYQAYYLALKAIRVLCSKSYIVFTKESMLAAEMAGAYVAESLETLSQLVHSNTPQEIRKIAKLRSRFRYDLDTAIGISSAAENLTQFNESMKDDLLHWRVGMNWKERVWKSGPPDWYTQGKKKIAHHRVNGS